VIALYYYANVARAMWMSPVPDEDRTPIRVPPALATSIGICVLVVLAMGVYPQIFARLGDLAHFG
jgi:NADH:ubiquinone oxidoreductase subunit 2 (subunit N)